MSNHEAQRTNRILREDVYTLRRVVRAMHERIQRGGPRNYNDKPFIFDYFPDDAMVEAYWSAMNEEVDDD